MKARKLLTTFALALPLVFILLLVGTTVIYNLQQDEIVIVEPSEIELAHQELAAKNYNAAEIRLKDLLANNPQYADAALLLNDIYKLRGATEAQITLLEQYKNSPDSSLLNALADVYYSSQKLEEALVVSQQILQVDLNNKPAILRIIKIYAITRDQENAVNFLKFINMSGVDVETKFLISIALMNFKEDRLESLQNLYPELPDNIKKVADIYIANYPLLNESGKELSARANIVYSLLDEQFYELALPFAQEMAEINKYYENSLLYRAIINVHNKNFDSAWSDLELLEKYYPGKNATKVLMLECSLVRNDTEKVNELVHSLSNSFIPEDNKKYIEAFKLLYAYQNYQHLKDLFLSIGAQIDGTRSEVDYLALKSMIFLKDLSAVEGLILKLNQNYFALNSEQQAELRAAEALLAFENEKDVSKAEILINEAYVLNNKAFFVYYINGYWNPDLSIINRATELDLHNEIPAE